MTNKSQTRPPHMHTFLGAKGGQGTTVTASAYALIHAQRGTRTLLLDAAPGHDCASVLGLPEPHDPENVLGVTPTLDLARTTSADNLDKIGQGYDLIVIDGGVNPAATVGHFTLVTRACYLSLRKALALQARPDDAVLVEESGRALRRDDLAAVLDLAVAATVPLDPSIARTVDSGLLTSRVPASLEALVNIDARCSDAD